MLNLVCLNDCKDECDCQGTQVHTILHIHKHETTYSMANSNSIKSYCWLCFTKKLV